MTIMAPPAFSYKVSCILVLALLDRCEIEAGLVAFSLVYEHQLGWEPRDDNGSINSFYMAKHWQVDASCRRTVICWTVRLHHVRQGEEELPFTSGKSPRPRGKRINRVTNRMGKRQLQLASPDILDLP